MEQKLTEFFPFKGEEDVASKLVLLSDQQSMSGQFLFNMMLEKFIKDKRVVHVVSVNHSRHHYDALLRKMSYDLMKLEADNMFHLHPIKMSQSSTNYNYDENIDASDMFIQVNITPQDIPSTSTTDMTPQHQATDIMEKITTACLDIHTNTVVMIDDLIALDVALASCGNLSHHQHSCTNELALNMLYNFQTLLSLKKIHSLVVYSDDPVALSHASGTLAVEAFQGHTNEEDGVGGCVVHSANIAELIKYRADVSIVASKLESGYSADVHGQLLITTSGVNNGGDSKSTDSKHVISRSNHIPHQQRLLFKASDAGIKCALH